jgi:hypothetical protein
MHDSKWQLCSYLCLNKNQKPYLQDLEWFCSKYKVPDKISKNLNSFKTYCAFCKMLDRYAFLCCKGYTGPGAVILTCLTCEHYDGKECKILFEILDEEARRLAAQDRHNLITEPPSPN